MTNVAWKTYKMSFVVAKIDLQSSKTVNGMLWRSQYVTKSMLSVISLTELLFDKGKDIYPGPFLQIKDLFPEQQINPIHRLQHRT